MKVTNRGHLKSHSLTTKVRSDTTPWTAPCDRTVRQVTYSDRGVQYASSAYVDRLESVGALPSMSAKGNPYDNAKAESFFKTLKREEVYLKDYRTLGEAEASIGQLIEDVYNQKPKAPPF